MQHGTVRMGTKVAAQCHCGTFKATLDLDVILPHSAIPCHCNICRRLSGALTHSSFTVSPTQSPSIESYVASCKLTKFSTSSDIDRYFCTNCGSHAFIHTHFAQGAKSTGDGWKLLAGLVEGVVAADGTVQKARLERIVGNEYVADTRDGGLARVFTGWTEKGEEQAKNYAVDPSGREINLLDYVGEHKHLVAEAEKDEILQASCYCKGVDFQLTRPDQPEKKYEAGLCMCRSCRLSFGQPVTGWAMTIPNGKLIQPNGAIHDGSLFGTLKRFQSSDHVMRDFCSRCGSCVFFYTTHRPGKLDIAFGILTAKEGALAKSWFSWGDDRGVHYKEDAIDVDMLKMVDEHFGKLESL